MAPAAKSAEFEKAVVDSRKLKTKPTQDELLGVHVNFLIFFRRDGNGKGLSGLC